MANVILRVKKEDGSWAEIPALVGPEGPQGVSIDDIVLKSQEGGVSTYSILLSNGTEKTFQVTDGAIITDVSLTNTDVLIDTYKISTSDGSFFNFKVTNGRGIKSIAKTSTDVLSDTYTISYNDNTSSTYTITNGRGIDYIEKDETIGLSDRYTIHYNDGSTSYYHVVNGEAGPAGGIGNRIYLSGLVDKVNDEEGYKRVKELKESKFDLSKFTVAGNPTITDDGVASGFSNSSYLTTTTLLLSGNFEIYGNFKLGSYFDSGLPFGLLGSSGLPVRFQPKNGGTGFYFYYNNTWINNTTFVWELNTEYSFKVSYINSKLNLYLSKVNQQLVKYTNDISDWEHYDVTGVRFGFVDHKAFNGSIDLKQFSITVDGKEVFSGNPTSLDTIKANNYTVTGSPTITDDGIYQQNATSNGILEATIGKTFTQSVKVGGRYTVKLDSKTEQLMDLISFGSNNILLYDGIVKSGDDWYVEVSTGTTTVKTLIEIPLKDGDIIDTELIIDSTNMTLYAKLNESVTYTATVTSLGTGIINKYQLSTSARSWSGKVDLNTIHVYIDGNLVYQPCLKIPYTITKTCSKIVDAAYRLRVEDCYNQYGTGNYYLFSNATEQFALPMPDLYGLIESLLDITPIEGADW